MKHIAARYCFIILYGTGYRYLLLGDNFTCSQIAGKKKLSAFLIYKKVHSCYFNWLGRREYSFKRTIKYDSHHLDKPDFVGSYEIGEYVYFFFREIAVEYMNCGKSVYSRIARVCKRDTGGKNILHQNWATYLKARLNCSIPGEFPYFFNEIQSVYKIPDDDTRFYAVFTTNLNGERELSFLLLLFQQLP